MSAPETDRGWDEARIAFLLTERDNLKGLLAEHQELGRVQGNCLDELTRELGETQAKLRAAQIEIQRLTTMLNGYSGKAR